jgi:hypothetical protein
MFIFHLHKKSRCSFGLQRYNKLCRYAKKIAKFLRNGDFFIGAGLSVIGSGFSGGGERGLGRPSICGTNKLACFP